MGLENSRRALVSALRDPDGAALFLDFDGTLVDIAATPEGVSAPSDLPAVLARVRDALGGAVALVSGRRIDDLDARLTPFRSPAAGVHGAEMRFDAEDGIDAETPRLDPRLRDEVIRLTQGDPRLLVEDKGRAVAVHFRRAEHLGPELERKLEAYVRASDLELKVQTGRKVVEILGRSVSKGEALRRLMGAKPFFGRRPIMIGDDRTDLSAFDACAGFFGCGLRVAGEFFSADEADFASPAEVRQWLGELAGPCFNSPEKSR